MNKYIGVTIGPIFETINLTTSPAALWAASYMFSSISKSVCETIVEKGVPEEDIIAPYYKSDDPLINKNDGVGLFHDRIIFKSGNFPIAEFANVREIVLRKIAGMFSIGFEYLDEYVMIAAAEFEAENPVSGSAGVLNALELATPYVFCEKSNEILSLFVSDDEKQQSVGRNEAIKQLIKKLDKFQLLKTENSLKNIYDIVSTGKGKKKHKYFAIIRSDGDNTNKIIESLDADNIREFSKDCLNHCAKISELVEKFDGVTIYSGGDDLLAILPCESRDGKSPLEFAVQANSLYEENFKKYNKNATISFGITVAYYKSQLGEALADSAYLLFDIAKTRKNSVALRIQKHSGQTDAMLISNDALAEFISLQEAVLQQEGEQIALSLVSKIAQLDNCFKLSKDEQTIKNLFKNMIDVTGSGFWQKWVPEFFAKLQNGLEINAITETGITDDTVKTLVYVIRIINFFTEKEAGV